MWKTLLLWIAKALGEAAVQKLTEKLAKPQQGNDPHDQH